MENEMKYMVSARVTANSERSQWLVKFDARLAKRPYRVPMEFALSGHREAFRAFEIALARFAQDLGKIVNDERLSYAPLPYYSDTENEWIFFYSLAN